MRPVGISGLHAGEDANGKDTVLTKVDLSFWRALADNRTVSQSLRAPSAAQARVWSSCLEEDMQPLTAEQMPLSSLLLAVVLSGSLWWGIIAGLRWIWQAT